MLLAIVYTVMMVTFIKASGRRLPDLLMGIGLSRESRSDKNVFVGSGEIQGR
jgi:hypothetical protein